MWSNKASVRCTVNSATARATYFGLLKSECAKPSEGDVFEPFESRQQAKCALLLPKRRPGYPDQVFKED